MVGDETLEDHHCALENRFKLKVAGDFSDNGKNFRFGNDLGQKSTAEALTPAGLGGNCAAVKWSVLPGRAPFLLAKEQMKALKAKVDFENNIMHIPDLDSTICLEADPRSGHYLV